MSTVAIIGAGLIDSSWATAVSCLRYRHWELPADQLPIRTNL